MLRCRIPIAILLALMLPLQSFASGTCCQAGQGSCCSISTSQPAGLTTSCCSRIAIDAPPAGCRNGAAAREDAEKNSTVVDRGSCHCKKNPQDRPATDSRRQLDFESFHTFHETAFAVAGLTVYSPLKVDFTDRSPGLRLHAIYCVWLN